MSWHRLGGARADGVGPHLGDRDRALGGQLGAADEEIAMTFPGDELIEHPVTVTTRAVSVGVPPPEVWPWVAQFGQGRGGLYSYDWLENIFGSGIHSTDRILVDHQDVTVGDQVWITQPGHPADLGHVVAVVDAPHALVTAQSTPQKPAAFEDSPWTWAFVIQPDASNESRVVSRNRYEPQGTMVDLLMDRLVGPVGFAMERRTLLGIAERANRAAALPTPPAWREPLWFAALLATGAGLVGLLATRTSPARKALFATLITAAATLVLLRFPLGGSGRAARGGNRGPRRATAPNGASRQAHAPQPSGRGRAAASPTPARSFRPALLATASERTTRRC